MRTPGPLRPSPDVVCPAAAVMAARQRRLVWRGRMVPWWGRDGAIYIGDSENHRIRKLTPVG